MTADLSAENIARPSSAFRLHPGRRLLPGQLRPAFPRPCQGDPWAAYCALREACPTPFSGFQSLPDGGAVLSLSPERFVKVSQRQVETRPIKGTRPRGVTPAEDAANAAELLASPKDRAENLMIVDLLRNDLGRTCRTGSVRCRSCSAWKATPTCITWSAVSPATGG
jgi:para-aminobenzoate synthetase component 1